MSSINNLIGNIDILNNHLITNRSLLGLKVTANNRFQIVSCGMGGTIWLCVKNLFLSIIPYRENVAYQVKRILNEQLNAISADVLQGADKETLSRLNHALETLYKLEKKEYSWITYLFGFAFPIAYNTKQTIQSLQGAVKGENFAKKYGKKLRTKDKCIRLIENLKEKESKFDISVKLYDIFKQLSSSKDPGEIQEVSTQFRHMLESLKDEKLKRFCIDEIREELYRFSSKERRNYRASSISLSYFKRILEMCPECAKLDKIEGYNFEEESSMFDYFNPNKNRSPLNSFMDIVMIQSDKLDKTECQAIFSFFLKHNGSITMEKDSYWPYVLIRALGWSPEETEIYLPILEKHLENTVGINAVLKKMMSVPELALFPPGVGHLIASYDPDHLEGIEKILANPTLITSLFRSLNDDAIMMRLNFLVKLGIEPASLWEQIESKYGNQSRSLSFTAKQLARILNGTTTNLLKPEVWRSLISGALAPQT